MKFFPIILLTLSLITTSSVQAANRLPQEKWAKIIENKKYFKTLRIEGPAWNNTLIRGITIIGADRMGIFVRDVDNIRIENCTIKKIAGNGIQLSSRGSTNGVTIARNHIEDCLGNGISVPQRANSGIDHLNLQIIRNTIKNSGLKQSGKGAHGIYVQCSEFQIIGNIVTGARWGNGISVRSSGIVRNNVLADVDGIDYGKRGSGIAYFSDHKTGTSQTLHIENNLVFLDTIRSHKGAAISMLGFSGKTPESFRVKRAVFQNNIIITDGRRQPITIHQDWMKSGYEIINRNNVVKKETSTYDYVELRNRLMKAFPQNPE